MPRTRKSHTKKSMTRYSVPRSVSSYRGEMVIKKLKFALNLGVAHDLTSSSGAMSPDYIYRANSIYDFYQGTGGHQPRGTDQYLALFRNFAVLGSKITLDLGYGTASATSLDMLCQIITKDGSTAITNHASALEAPRRKAVLITANHDRAKLVAKYSYKINGCEDILDMPSLWGTDSADCSRQWYYHIIGYQPSAGTEHVSFTGVAEFTVAFFHAVQPPQS